MGFFDRLFGGGHGGRTDASITSDRHRTPGGGDPTATPFDLTVERSEEIIAKNVALATALPDGDGDRLVNLVADLIEGKDWEGVGDLALTDEVLVTIAANAAIPILNLDQSVYSRVAAILVRPGTNRSRIVQGTSVEGVLGESDQGTIGEAAAHRGPISISWSSALPQSRRPSYGDNVVVHEFAHKIDMANGAADGMPPLLGSPLERWNDAMLEEFERARDEPLDHVLSSYAWTNHAEFFAVLTEAFFCTPSRLRSASPRWWKMLCELYATEPGQPRDL